MFSNLRVGGCRWFLGLVLGAVMQDALAGEESGGLASRDIAGITNIAGFYRAFSDGYHKAGPVSLEGVVCQVDADGGGFLIGDGSGAVPVRPGSSALAAASVGQRLRIEGRCSAVRNGIGWVLVPPLLVDNDSLHDPKEKSASLHLNAGPRSIRLRWFNSQGLGLLRLSYEGPGLPRQSIPNDALCRAPSAPEAGPNSLLPGLNYRSFEGEWSSVPDFDRLRPTGGGVRASFDVAAATRRESVGLEFTGFLKVPRDGVYTFYLESDDGSLLFVDDSQLRLIPLGQTAAPEPRRLVVGEPFSGADEFQWVRVEGEVTRLQEDGKSVRLELGSGEDRWEVDVADATRCIPELLPGSRVGVTGICLASSGVDRRKHSGALWVLQWQEAELLSIAAERWEQPLVEIASLSNTTGLVRFGGKLRSLESRRRIVVQDSTGEIAVECVQESLIRPGSLVEVLASHHREAPGELKGVYVRETLTRQETNEALPVLTTIKQLRRMDPEGADRRYPVRAVGVVTAYFSTSRSLVIQDADLGVYVSLPLEFPRGWLEIGDLCEVRGHTRAGTFAPMIDATSVTRLGLGRLPEPVRPALDQILNGSLDCQYVEIEGLVTGVTDEGVRMLTRVGRLEMDLGGRSQHEWKRFEDAVVRVKGCMLAVYDLKTGFVKSGRIRLLKPSITLDRAAPLDPFAIETRAVAGLRSFDPKADPFERVKVCGQIVHSSPSGLFCMMDGPHGLRFYPKSHRPLPEGMMVEVVGILDLGGASPVLHEAFVRSAEVRPLPAARRLGGTNMLSGRHDSTRVQLESILVSARRESGEMVFELNSGLYLYSARLNSAAGSVGSIPLGSQLSVTGVYLGEGGNWAAGRDIQNFSIVIASPDDIRILAKPSWWTPRRLLTAVGVLGAVLLSALSWIWVLRRQVEERTRSLAEQIQARQRVEQERAIDAERTRLARDLHDDLGGGLTEISMLGSLARDSALGADRRAGFLDQLTDRARQLVTTLDEIVWAVNPRYDSVASLAGYYSLYAQRFLGVASLACHLDIPDTLPDQPLESKVRHSLFLAFKEALNNVVRHARATDVWLRIRVEGNDLTISVADNGRGLEDAPAATGMDGLPNMQARLAALGGWCEIRSAPDAGTTVLFRMKLTSRKP